MKAYKDFTDVFGNKYGFENYADFAKFWFSLKTKTAKLYFGKNFEALQKAAANSKEARTKKKLKKV